MIISWEYIAGFIDCDGAIVKSVKKKYKYSPYTYSIIFTQHVKNYDGMVEINKFLIENNITTYFFKRTTSTSLGETNMCDIVVKKQKSLNFLLKKIEPFLIFKKRLAKEAIQYLEMLNNKRGVSNTVSKMSKKRYWSDKETTILTELADNGYSYDKIGEKLNRSNHSIAQKFSKLKIKVKNNSQNT